MPSTGTHIHDQRCDYTTATRSHCWRNCTSPTNLQKASESRQGLVPSAGPFRCGPSERDEPHLLLAPPGPSPNGLRRSIRHAPTPTSAIPAMALRTEATQSASSMSQAALRPMRACLLAKHTACPTSRNNTPPSIHPYTTHGPERFRAVHAGAHHGPLV